MTEAETKRHQIEQEALQRRSNELQEQQNAINQAHYERMDYINQLNLYETTRANKAREQENIRSNVASEYIRERSNAISASQVAETSRHQKAMESIERSLNSSLISKNMAQVSEIGANTGWIQARTETEFWNKQNAANSVDLLVAQRHLADEQARTEATKRLANTYYGLNQGIQGATAIFKTIVPIVSGGSAGGQPDFWMQMERQLAR